MNEEFELPDAPNFSAYLRGAATGVLTAEEISDETQTSGRCYRVLLDDNEIGVYRIGKPIGRDFTGFGHDLTVIGYAGNVPGHTKPNGDPDVVLLAFDKERAKRVDRHSIPFP